MSYFTKANLFGSKRTFNFKTSMLLFGATVCAVALLSGTAYADPKKKLEKAAETPIEMPMDVVDEAVDQAKDKAIDKAKDTTKDAIVAPMDLPQSEDNTGDVIQTEPENLKASPVNAQQTKVEPPVWETPAPDAAFPILDIAQSCYQQESGALECICEGDKACAELTSSDICEPGTNWRNDEGFGGCTKKAE